MRKWILIAGGVLVGGVVAALAAGAMPREHVASSSVILHQPSDSVWRVVRDLGAVPEWWPEIESSVREDDPAGREKWAQRMDGAPLPIVVIGEDRPRRLVTRVDVPDDATFGGTWTYEIDAVEGGSRVTVTETGFINNLFFRFMANAVFGLHGTMDGYLRALGARFGEEVTPVHGAGAASDPGSAPDQNPSAGAPAALGEIAFHSDRDGGLDIYAIGEDGSGLRRLTSDSAFANLPAWSPDGSRIAFMSDRDGNYELGREPVAVVGLREHVDGHAIIVTPAEGRLDPVDALRDGNPFVALSEQCATGDALSTACSGAPATPS